MYLKEIPQGAFNCWKGLFYIPVSPETLKLLSEKNIAAAKIYQ